MGEQTILLPRVVAHSGRPRDLESQDDPRWKEKLNELGVRIKHSPFTDEHRFKSFRLKKLGENNLF